MASRLLLLGLSFLGLAGASSAQIVPAPLLVLGDVEFHGPVAVDGPPAQLLVPWTYSSPVAGGGFNLVWEAPACGAAGVTVTGAQNEAFESGNPATVRNGTTSFQVTATREAPGEQKVKCSFSAHAEDALGQGSDKVRVDGAVLVDFVGEIRVHAPVRNATAGPQKLVRFDFLVENLGNSRTVVEFELMPRASDGWKPIRPDAAIIGSLAHGDPTNSTMVTFMVATPYHNGPNSGSADFTLVARAFSSQDERISGNAVEVTFSADVDGVYIPAPPAAFIFLAFAGALLARRLTP